MKNLILAIMLVTIGTALPIDASAKIDSATMERQRATNRARLNDAKKHRATTTERRIFKKSDAEIKDARSLKLDAIPPSPRRTASKKSGSTTKPERSPEAATAPKE